MGAFADYFSTGPGAVAPSAAADAPASVDPSIGGEFSKGVSRGLRSGGAQLEQFGGLAAEAAGAPGVAGSLYSGAQSLRDSAASPQFAPESPTFADAHGVGPNLRYLAGKAGEMAPMMAGAVGTGLATGNPVLGGAAFMAPFEAGAVAQGQQADPQAAAQPAATRLGKAALGGGAASLLENAMPAGLAGQIGGKLTGEAVGQMAAKGVGRTLAENVAHGAAVNAAGMGAGDVAKQYAVNQDKPIDVAQAGESALGGAAVGGAFGVGGAAADLARSRAGNAGAAIKGVAGSIGDAAGSVGDSVKSAMGGDTSSAPDVAPTAGSSVTSTVGDLIQKGRTAVDSAVDKVLNRQPLGDPEAFNTAEGQAASDAAGGQAAQGWGAQMLNDAGLTPEMRQKVTDAVQGAGTEAGNMAMAGLKKVYDAGNVAVTKAQAFRQSFGAAQDAPPKLTPAQETMMDVQGYSEAQKNAYRTQLGPKQSADYSGTNSAIADTLTQTLGSSRPDLTGNSQALSDLSDGLRQAMTRLPNGQLSSDTIARLIDALGPDTAPTLAALHDKLGGDPATEQTFYKNLNEISDTQEHTAKLQDTIGAALTPEAQATSLASDLPGLTDGLMKWARGDLVGAGDSPAKQAFVDSQMRRFMAQHFGDKADAVSLAIEKEAQRQLGTKEAPAREGSVNADGDVVRAEQLDRIQAPGPAVMHPDVFRAQNEPGLNRAAQQLKDMQAKYPDHNVRFEKAEGSENMGHVIAEKAADPEVLSDADVQGMRLDTKRYPNSKDRLEVPAEGGKLILDTRRIAKVMDKRLQYSAADEQGGRAARMARMFTEGVARLQAQHGKFEVPDDAVVGQVGGKNMTYGDAKALRNNTVGDRMSADGKATLARLRKDYAATKDPQSRAEIEQQARELMQGEKDRELSAEPFDTGSNDETVTAAPKDAEIHQAAADNAAKDLLRTSNMDGTPHGPPSDRASAIEAVKNMAGQLKANAVKGVQALGDKLNALADKYVAMTPKDQGQLGRAILHDKTPSERAALINPLAEKYANAGVEAKADAAKPASGDGMASPLGRSILARQEYLDNPPKDYSTVTAQGHVEWAQRQLKRVTDEQKGATDGRSEYLGDLKAGLNRLLKKGKSVLEGDASLHDIEGSPDPKALAAKQAALVKAATSSDPTLTKELSTSTDAKGLQRAAAVLADRAPQSEALRAANDRLGTLVKDPDVAYSLQTKKYSMEGTDPKADNTDKTAGVAEHVEKVLGKSVKLKWANFTHAGEYTHDIAQGIIRLSVHALDPMSAAFHESFHAFAAQLRDAGAHDITGVLEKAAQSAHALRQMTEMFRDQPEVLKQLRDPEERAAYMYQLWAAGKLEVGPAAKGVFGKIAEFVRHALGIWSNDERALHIMQHFNSGEYAKSLGNVGAVRRAVMEPGHNQALEVAKSFTAPLLKLANAMASTGDARLRDTGLPALDALADAIKRRDTDGSGSGRDQGYVPTSGAEARRRLSAFGRSMEGYSPDQLHEAMEALQRGRSYSGEGGEAIRAAQGAIKGVLQDTRDYMLKAGVDIGSLGKDYFPRVWDTHYISKNQQAFRDMLEPYIRSGDMKGSADDLIRRLAANGGNEASIETRMPGMQFKKERVLDFIKPEDAAQFVSKDLLGTMTSYITQATRRAEWERRLGSGKLEKMITDAKAQGATPEQLATVDKYLRGIDGTLGDNLNPTARRLMGNMIVYQNLRLLPLAAFSSVVDPLGVMVRGGTLKDSWRTFKRGIAEIPESYGRKASSDEGARLAELTGVIDNAMLASTMGDMYTQGMVGGTAKKLNNWFFKANMMEGLNRSFRIGASEAAMAFIARHAEGGYSPHSARWMKELGLNNSDVKMVPGENGHPRIALSKDEGLSDEQVTRVHGAINQWVDGAVLRPDAADKPIWMNDPHYALFAHLKQFIFSFQKTIIGRVAHEFEHGNYAPAMALASYVPVMMAADTIKGLIQGGGQQPDWKKGWGPEDYLGYESQRAGLMGVSQFGFDSLQSIHRGGTGVGALVGPTLEQFGDAVQLLGGHKQFGPMLLNAMPANALYAHSLGVPDMKDPMFSD